MTFRAVARGSKFTVHATLTVTGKLDETKARALLEKADRKLGI